MREIVSVYRSSKNSDTYVYVAKKQGIKAIPDALKELVGKPIHAFDMLLTEDKKLARVEAVKVLESISEQGFFLQLPPPKEDLLAEMKKASE
ncbi:YcgL domain-containing protein [Reinekea marina]|uniref:YcgL domain-containing protein ACFOND_14075 n=1 Tax=Reinekea marina TaxID=1310421 RepID=A0ABV7WV54_9GAMM|nr:YcgL domain-containing protein [Reinekea marina]MBU2862244.1 YcgL domain-containing protein [Reinekea forsetii]MDN3649792.1 YcgL domain-containing protein [Reinekea marina]